MSHLSHVKLPSFIPELEALRAYMAWWVVIGHVASTSGYYSPGEGLLQKLIAMNGQAVSVFICLSGFLISTMLYRNPDQQYKAFIWRRAWRLFPVYLLILVLAILSWDLTWVARTESDWRSSAYVASFGSKVASIQLHWPLHVVAHTLLLHGLLPDQLLPYSGEAFIAPAWSLTLEWQFYLVAPFLIILARKNYSYFTCIAAILYLIKFLLKYYGITFSYGAFLPCKFEYFAIGIGTAVIYQDLSNGLSLKSSILRQLPLGIITAISAKLTVESPVPVMIWAAIFLLIYWWRVKNYKIAGWLSTIFSNRAALFFGRISYSTYIVHILIIDLVTYGIVKNGHGAWKSLEALTLILPSAVILTTIASYFLYQYIEAPGIEFGKQSLVRKGIGKRPKL